MTVAKGSAEVELPMVLCSTCGDAIAGNAACPTCGEVEPGEAHADSASRLDEGLLYQVGVALAAKAALARRTAAERNARAARLTDDAVVLRGRLRTQAALLRRLVSEQPRMAPAVTAALERVEMVLEQREADAGWSVHAQLPRNSSCGAVARRLVREYVQAHLDEEAAEDVLLVVSELSNNAFVHGEGSISLHVKRLPDRLRLEVRDEGKPRRIERRPESGDAGGGHGLFLVDRLSVAWGTTAGSGHVWSEIGVAGAPATA